MEHTQLSSKLSLKSSSSSSSTASAAIDRDDKHRQIGAQVGGFLNATTYQLNSPALVSLLIGLLAIVSLSINEVDAIVDQTASNSRNYNQAPQRDEQQQRALEAELNSILQQNDALLSTGNDKWLAEAIISRLMVDNLTNSNSMMNGNANEQLVDSADLMNFGELQPGSGELAELANQDYNGGGEQQQASSVISQLALPSAAEALRLRKLMSMLQNYETFVINGGNGQNYSPFPLLPNSQAATMKRAAQRMGAYLQPRNPQATSYGRDSFNFGLGKRGPGKPIGLVSSAGNILRFGDSLGGGGGGLQPVSQLGKRPSAHRYDFGLGKRVASPAYPTRYDFGLGKRAPNRIRYDFGLGK